MASENDGDPYAQVREFWEIGHIEDLPDHPTMPGRDNLRLCMGLIREEVGELVDAVIDGDLVEMADALGDIIYVATGMGLACGFPMRRVFDEIHRSNMAKFPGGVVTRRESDGKVLKPDDWQPPDIKGILDEATDAATLCGHEWTGRVCTAPRGHALWHHDGNTSWRQDRVEEQCTAVLRWGERCIHPEDHSGRHVDSDGYEHDRKAR